MPAQLKKLLKADLCPTKPDAALLDLGDTEVEVSVSIQTEKPVPLSKFNRLVIVAEKTLDRYTKVIQTEVTTLERKIGELQNRGDADGMERMAKETTTSVQGACRSIQAAVEVDIAAHLKKEERDDQNLLEAKVVVGVKITFKVIAVTKDALELAVTGGADVTAWASLAKDIAGLAAIIYDITKTEAKLRQDLLDAIGEFCTDKQRQVIEEEQAAKSRSAKFVFVAKEIYRKVKPKSDAAEAARKKYRNEVTSMRQNVDKLFTKIETLEKQVKEAKTLKQGVTLGAKLMVMKREGTVVESDFQKAETFSDDMTSLLQEGGLEVDDRTIVQKIATFKGVKDMASSAKEIASAAKDIADIVKSIATLAA